MLKVLKYFLILFFVFVLVLAALFSIFSALRLFFDFSPTISNVLIMFCGCLGVFITMAFSSKILNRGGIILGLIFGLVLSCLIGVLTVFFRGNFLNLFDILKILMVALSSFLGGFVGSRN